jgi:hypothetical protein
MAKAKTKRVNFLPTPRQTKTPANYFKGGIAKANRAA